MGYVGVKPSAVPLTSADIADGIITSAKIVDGTIVNADINASAAIVATKLTGISSQPFRNIVINGDMQIAQRSTSVSSITATGYYTLDRFQTALSSLGTWTQSQSTDVPSGYGFSKSLKMDCTTADASPSAGDFMVLGQYFEGQNLQYLKKGTAGALSLTASFWVKSTKTGTFICELLDNDNSRTISKSYTVSVSNTWEFKTVTFPGDTSGALDNNNERSLDLNFWLGAGSTYSSGTLQTTWGARVDANRAVGQVNIADSTSNDFFITGVQLEAGTSATDFEFLPIDVSLARCQRYFYVHVNGANQQISGGFLYNNTTVICNIEFSNTMRSAPTGTFSNNTDDFIFYRNNDNDTFDTFTTQFETTTDRCNIRNDTQISGTGGQAGFVLAEKSTAKITFSSEL
jgi:hypothetical protein